MLTAAFEPLTVSLFTYRFICICRLPVVHLWVLFAAEIEINH